jgi:predicted nucleic acid-binding protein
VGPLILDASVLIGLLDRADAHHRAAVEAVEAADAEGIRLVAPASAYSEALVAFARAGRLPDARGAIAAMGITVAPLTAATAEGAAALRAQHPRLRLPDAIVAASARELGGDLLSYDERLNRVANAPTSRPPAGDPGHRPG